MDVPKNADDALAGQAVAGRDLDRLPDRIVPAQSPGCRFIDHHRTFKVGGHVLRERSALDDRDPHGLEKTVIHQEVVHSNRLILGEALGGRGLVEQVHFSRDHR